MISIFIGLPGFPNYFQQSFILFPYSKGFEKKFPVKSSLYVPVIIVFTELEAQEELGHKRISVTASYKH
jgi:hypothetical protein